MVINYFKLKFNIYINRFKSKPKNVAYGELFGYFFIIAIFSVIAYFVFLKLFNSDSKKIFPIIILNFLIITIISLGNTFKYLYSSIFEASDKEILFTLPCKNIDLIIIKYIEVMIKFLMPYIFMFLPTLIGFLIIDIKFIFSFIFLLICTNLIAICIISLLVIVLFISTNISKGKNIKATCLLISGVFTTTVLIVSVFFLKNIDIKFSQNSNILKILFLPFNTIYQITSNYTNTINNLPLIGLTFIYTFLLFMISFKVFSKSIDSGILLLDINSTLHLPLFKIFFQSYFFKKITTFLSKRIFSYESVFIWVKDLYSILSDFMLIKLLAQVIFFFTIFNSKMDFSSNKIIFFVAIFIKSLFLVFTLSYYLIRSEGKYFYLILNSGISYSDILKSKILTVCSIFIPFIIIFDIIAGIFNSINKIELLYFIILDILIIILLSIYCIVYAFKYSDISTESVIINFRAGLSIFVKIMNFIVPIFVLNTFTVYIVFSNLEFRISKVVVSFSVIFASILFGIYSSFKTIKQVKTISHEIY